MLIIRNFSSGKPVSLNSNKGPISVLPKIVNDIRFVLNPAVLYPTPYPERIPDVGLVFRKRVTV